MRSQGLIGQTTLLAGDPRILRETSGLLLISYHYIRDFSSTRYPRIKALDLDLFRDQVTRLCERFEIATWESFTAFLSGEYRPRRPLCQLHFDDGLMDHIESVLPVITESKIQGTFLVITRCVEENWVATVHKNHFLMASLDFQELCQRFARTVEDLSPETSLEVGEEEVRSVYRWDSPEVAKYKFLVNYRLPPALREQVIDLLFADHFPDEKSFARQLYLSWDDIEQLRGAGMTIGGHSHCHRLLGTLSREEQEIDVRTCHDVLERRLGPGEFPFCYPYGRPGAFDERTVEVVRSSGFSCAFTAISGIVQPGDDRFTLRRNDVRESEAFLAAGNAGGL